MKVLVGLSGGVDSSVAAYILKEKGYEVTGATMKIWGERPELKNVAKSAHGACFGPDEAEDIESAAKVAKMLDIPYHVFDCTKEYENIVLKNFKEEYKQGKTPNPCIRCNAFVKFGVLPYLAKENGIIFDKFATGHYARIVPSNAQSGGYFLKKAVDDKKDQTYFLYRLKQAQLKDIIFPLGELTKDEVRKIALKAGLDTAQKPDSQDFYQGDYNELLGLDAKPGNIVNMEGKILGTHNGIWNFTVGQRKGLNISSAVTLYVLELCPDTNEVIVGDVDKTFKKTLVAGDLNWVSIEKPADNFKAGVKIRYGGKISPANVIIKENKALVEFDEYQKSIAPGQSVVFYEDDILLGGGIIEHAG